MPRARSLEAHLPRLQRKTIESLSEFRNFVTAPSNPFRKQVILVSTLMLAVALVLFLRMPAAYGQSTTQTTTTTSTALTSDNGIGLVAAGVAIAGSCLGAGYAVGKAASSAAAAIVEKPSVFGPLLILAGLGEGIAIYGLLVAFQILSKIP
jgi:V/A-type H+/Na+-transporting ATPase subunit K